MGSPFHVFGIRHHGPGSARTLLGALEALDPDCVLVEGPPDADDLIAMASSEAMVPPVALLVYRPDAPSRGVFYPFAAFSPEWQAIRFALERGLPVRFMDLPQHHRLAIESEVDADVEAEDDEDACQSDAPASAIPLDPLGALAEAAGFPDGERWWEHMVEHRRRGDHPPASVFRAVASAMTEMRTALEEPRDEDEPRREAWMRRTMRSAKREGFERIGVVCGAWHAPALEEMPPAAHDQALLKGMRRVKTAATWVPWTHARLGYASGYGAGVESPGWYEHLWTCEDAVSERWMTRIARLFREQDIDASSAHVIEAHRLGGALAALRGRSIPGLGELMEATEAVMCAGDPTPLALVHDKLIVGERLGEVAPEAPAVPLQRDLEALQKRLRIRPTAEEKEINLDLRQPMGLERSHLLHRLGLLGIAWGEQREKGRASGTFHEVWALRWTPELVISVIDAGRWGNTVEDAATARAIEGARDADLGALTGLFAKVLLAELSGAAGPLAQRVQDVAALSQDAGHLMDAVLPLARVLRYGTVRKTDADMVGTLVVGLLTRVCIALGPACRNIDADAAHAMLRRIAEVHEAVSLTEDRFDRDAWDEAIAALSGDDNGHPLLVGRANRLRLDRGAIDDATVGTRLSLALSRAAEPADGAAWLEGLLSGSGLVLLHDSALLSVLDGWVCGLTGERFDEVLPVLRRTFATFAGGERRQIGERIRGGEREGTLAARAVGAFDEERAAAVVPVLRLLLGSGDEGQS